MKTSRVAVTAAGLFALAALLMAGCSSLTFKRSVEPMVEREAFAALERAVNAYEDRHLAAFMSHVDSGYYGDNIVFESEIQREFSRWARIELQVYPAGAARNIMGNKVQLTVQFARQRTPVATGLPIKDSGTTQVVMHKRDGQWKIVSQRGVRLF